MMTFLGLLAAITVFMYLLICVSLFFMQSRLVFYPNLPGRELQRFPSDIGLNYESVELLTKDNVPIHGWFVKADQPKGILLFFHGNAGNISHRMDSLKLFDELGLSTLIIDYRGYGQSGGKVSEQGTYRDAEAAWDYLVEEKKIAPNRIIIFGRSLGGAVAAHLAAEKSSAGLILESAFTSVPDMAAGLYPLLPVRLFCRYSYDTKAAVQKISSPVLIVHSSEDEIIPFENGLELFGHAGEPKSFLKIRGGHNDGYLVSGPMYYEGLDKFVANCLKGVEVE